MAYKQTIDINNQNSNSAGTNYLTIKNDSNTAGSRAIVAAQVAGTTADDAMFQAIISGGQTWSLGVDNSDSDNLKVSQGGAPGSTDVMVMTTAGEITRPLNPCLIVYKGAGTANVTGDGTTYTIIPAVEIIEIGTGWDDTTGIYTVPVTGKYLFCSGNSFSGMDTSMTDYYNTITTSNQTYRGQQVNPANSLQGGVRYGVYFEIFADMDAGDTVFTTCTISGSTKTADISGATSNITRFMSCLIC